MGRCAESCNGIRPTSDAPWRCGVEAAKKPGSASADQRALETENLLLPIGEGSILKSVHLLLVEVEVSILRCGVELLLKRKRAWARAEVSNRVGGRK